jgi:hypothetical protein
LVEGFFILNKLDSINARTKRNNIEAQSKEEVTIFSVHKLQTAQERKEMAQARRRNLMLQHQEEIEEKVRKLLTSQVFRVHFLQK